MSAERTFVDTNVLVYLFDNDAPEKQARARNILASQGNDGRPYHRKRCSVLDGLYANNGSWPDPLLPVQPVCSKAVPISASLMSIALVMLARHLGGL